MAENIVIKLILFQGSGSIWNTRDWKTARNYKVVGTFIGSVPYQPHQVKEKGFPMLLTKNETTLLLEKNLAVLVKSRSILCSPDNIINERYQKAQQHSLLKQSELLQRERKIEIQEKTELIITGKLRKRRKLDPEYVMTDSDRSSIIQEELGKISEPSESYMLIEISTEDPWLNESSWEECEWSYPSTEAEKLEYATFRALWESGYWVTPGAKFGGNFLAYHGDPLLYHSSLIVRCTKRTDALPLLDLVTLSRLANSTNKTPVLAYFNANEEISFQSLTWVS